jgi:hypothetical protein
MLNRAVTSSRTGSAGFSGKSINIADKAFPGYNAAVPAVIAADGSVTTAAVPVKYDDTNAFTYLKKELKIDLHDTQEQSLVQALKNPEKYLIERKKKLEKIAEDLSHPYQDSIDFYFKAGYPMDEAIQLADIEIKGLYDSKIRQLNTIMPGASVMLTSAIDDQNAERKQVALMNGDVNVKGKSYYKKKYKTTA